MCASLFIRLTYSPPTRSTFRDEQLVSPLARTPPAQSPPFLALADSLGHFIPPALPVTGTGAPSAALGEGAAALVAPAPVGLRVKSRFISSARAPLLGGGDAAPPEPLTKPERPVMSCRVVYMV